MQCRILGILMTFALSLLATPLATEAQQLGKVYRIGTLAGNSQDPREQYGNEALQQSLRVLGYVEGKNVILEYHYTL